MASSLNSFYKFQRERVKKVLPGTTDSEQRQRFLKVFNECNIKNQDLSDIDICEHVP